MKRKTIFAVLVLLIIGISGCARKQSVSLERTEWKLVGWSISSVKADDYEITASFDDKTISGKSAVNSYSSQYSIDGDQISFTPFVSTEMAGSEDAMNAEAKFFGLMEQVRTLKVEGIKLILMDENKNELLVFQMTSPPEI
jgi:heat shock protein HslJ